MVHGALVLVSMVISSVGGTLTLGAVGSGCSIKIRGSLCAVAVAGKAVRERSIVMGILLGYITPLVLTLAMSYMLHRKVKKQCPSLKWTAITA